MLNTLPLHIWRRMRSMSGVPRRRYVSTDLGTKVQLASPAGCTWRSWLWHDRSVPPLLLSVALQTYRRNYLDGRPRRRARSGCPQMHTRCRHRVPWEQCSGHLCFLVRYFGEKKSKEKAICLRLQRKSCHKSKPTRMINYCHLHVRLLFNLFLSSVCFFHVPSGT
jgi:hypothetical protein